MPDRSPLAPPLLDLIAQAARRRGIPSGGRAALLARLEAFAADLLSGGEAFFSALFVSDGAAPGGGSHPGQDLWDLGAAFWRADSSCAERRRLDGSFYTPPGVIDQVLDRVWKRLFTGDGRLPSAVRVCDPAVGCGFFLLRLIERLLERNGRRFKPIRQWAETGLYGVDSNPAAVFMTRVILWLALSRNGEEFIPPANHFRAGDSLLGQPFPALGDSPDEDRPGAPAAPEAKGLDWTAAFPEAAGEGGFDFIVANPPYEVLTNFGKRPERKDLALALRRSGHYRDSLARQVNLYRCFIERSLALLKPGGAMAMVVPLSLARDAGASRLRRRLVTGNAASEWLLFGEDERLFPGVTQSACIFGAEKGAGPAGRMHIVTRNGAGEMTLADLERFGGGNLAIPFLDEGAAELTAWLGANCAHRFSDAAEARVGEVDQTVFRRCMADADTGCLLARGAHLSPFFLDLRPIPGRGRFLDLPAFLAMKGASADAVRERAGRWRVAQLGIRNMRTHPRLVAALAPPGVHLGNSLNVYVPKNGLSLEFLAGMLNSAILDRLFRLVSGNNNINLHEMLALPFPVAPRREDAEEVAAAYSACADIAAAGEKDGAALAGARARLDRAAAACYGLPKSLWRVAGGD